MWDQPNSSNAAVVVADGELRLFLSQFSRGAVLIRGLYLSSAVLLFEEELCGTVSPGRIASGQQILLDWSCLRWGRQLCLQNACPRSAD